MDGKQAWRTVKGNLTRAERSGDPERMLRAVAVARATFDEVGWPDWWARVDRLETDALGIIGAETRAEFMRVYGTLSPSYEDIDRGNA